MSLIYHLVNRADILARTKAGIRTISLCFHVTMLRKIDEVKV